MAVICTVIPTVKVNRNGNIVEEDSKLYMDLLDRARKLYPSYKEEDIRKEATFVYDKFKTIEFKRQYGDWELYKNVVNKTMTDEDIKAYSSKYNNNFNALKDDVIIELNDQMEPTIESFLSISGDSSVFTDSIESYPFISDSKQAYINRVLASIVIRLEDNLRDLKVKDFRNGYHVRGLVANVLEQYAISTDSSNFKSVKTMATELAIYLKDLGLTREDIKNNISFKTYGKWQANLLALAKDLRNNDDKHIWSSFINYFRATFYANISDFDTEDSMTMDELNGNAVAYEENNINKEYNSARQYKVNRKDTVSTRFKIFITKMLYNNESRIFASPTDITNTDVNGTRSYFNDYGLVMPFDINILWNDLIQASYDITNRTELIHNLMHLSVSVYNGQLQPLIDRMNISEAEKDNKLIVLEKNNFYNMFIKAVNMAMTEVTYSETTTYDEKIDGYKTQYRTLTANRGSYIVTKLYDEYRSNLTVALEYVNTDSLANIRRWAISEDVEMNNINSRKIETVADAINKVLSLSILFKLNYNLSTIAEYIHQTTGISTEDVLKLYHSEAKEDENTGKIFSSLVDVVQTFVRVIDVVMGETTNSNKAKDKHKQSRRVRELFANKFTLTDDGELIDVNAIDAENPQSVEVTPIVNDLKGYINQLALIGAYNPRIKIDLMYINVHGEGEYTPEFFNFITAMTQGLVNRMGKVNTEAAMQRFADYTSSPLMNHNRVIWNYDGYGFFNVARDKDGNIKYDANGSFIVDSVNEKAFLNFKVSRFNGVLHKDTRVGEDYVEMHDYTWSLDVLIRQMQGRYSLPSADSSRIYEFTMHNFRTTNILDKDIPIKLFDDNGVMINVASVYKAGLQNSDLYKAVKDTFRSEMKAMQTALDILFDYNEQTGRLSVKTKYLKSMDEVEDEFMAISETDRNKYLNKYYTYAAALQAYYDDNKVDINKLRGFATGIFWDGKSLLDKDGNPTGRIFKFHNLNFKYRNPDGSVTVRSIVDYIEDGLCRDNEYKFVIPDYPIRNIKPYQALYILKDEKILDKAFMSMFVDRVNSQVAEAIDFLYPIKNTIQSTNTYRNYFTYAYMSDDKSNPYKYVDKYDITNDKHWAYALANIILNHYVTDVNIQDIFTGFSYEFKDALDWAKRCNHNSRPGARTLSESTYSQIIVEDVKLKDAMLEYIAPINDNMTDDEKRISNIIRERYSGTINTADAFNIITQEECIKRFQEMGDYEDFELPSGNTLKQLIDENKTISPADYERVVQQLKYYYYNRGKSTLSNIETQNFILSHQDKNSTLVIFKNMYKGTNYETLANWMVQENIDSINFISGHKVGGMPAVTMFDKTHDGTRAKLNITYDEDKQKFVLKGYENGVNDYIHHLRYDRLVTQQTTPSHLVDETNKIGTQLEKRILDNINMAGKYIIGGVEYQGKTNNYEEGKLGVFEHYQMLLSSCAQDEMYKLLSDWGAVDSNGNIRKKEIISDGISTEIIEIDVDAVIRDLQDYFTTNDNDRNMLKAIIYVDGKPFIPFYHPTIKNKIESILLARITKRITNLRMKGAHVTIQPDIFYQPASVSVDKNGIIKGTQENINRLIKEGNITFSDDYWKERCELDENGDIVRDDNGNPVLKKDANLALRSEYVDKNGVFHPAEIILNSWDSRFKLNSKGQLDLNSIPEELRTMFGIRIPTEGHQSMFVAKVVGVMNNGASQAITPAHLIDRTGWDFDIDSIYLYIKDFEVINDEYVAYNIQDSELSKKQNLDYVANTYFSKRLHNIKDKYREQRVLWINKLIDIKAAIARKSAVDPRPTNDRLEELRNKLANARWAAKAGKSKAEREKARNDIDIINAEIDAEVEKATLVKQEDIDKMSNENFKKLHKRKNAIHKKLKSIKAQEEDAYNKFIEETVKPFYKNLDHYNKFSRKAKDNAIIDVWIGIHSDPKNLLNKEETNAFVESKQPADFVNSKTGYRNDVMNQHFLIDQIRIRNINNNIAVLKGSSISLDNILSIMGVTRTTLAPQFAIPVAIEYSNIVGYDETKSDAWVHEQIANVVGINKVGEHDRITLHRNEKYAVVWVDTLYNNVKGTWTDVNNQYISQQRHQLTTHILDAVKSNMGYNTNIYTVGDLALLSSFPISWNVNLKHGNAEVTGPNRFIYPVLVESQQIIVDLVKDIYIQLIEDNNTYTNISFNNVKGDYLLNAITSLAAYAIKHTRNGNVFNEFTYRYFKEHKDIVGLTEITKKINNFIGTETDINKLKKANETIKRIPSGSLKSASKFLYEFVKYIRTLNNEVTIISFENGLTADAYTKTISQLNKLLDDGIRFKSIENDSLDSLISYADYLCRQLEVLEYYTHCDKTVNALKKAQGALIAEKKGAGPKFTDSNKIFDSISNLLYNIRELKDEAKNKGISAEMINNMEYDYYSAVDITSRADILEKHLYAFNKKLKEISDITGMDFEPIDMPVCPFNINGRSMIEAIYPSMVNKDWKITDSAYPILQQQLISTNGVATNSFSDLLLSENPIFKNKINFILSYLNKNNDPIIKEAIVNYAIVYNLRKLGFFNEGNNQDAVLEDRARLLGCLNITMNEKGKPVYSNNVDLNRYNDVIGYKIHESLAGNKLSTHEQNIEEFKRLPVAIQLAMVKNTIQGGVTHIDSEGYYKSIEYKELNPNHILKLLRPVTMLNIILREGFIRLQVDYSTDIDYTRSSFEELINSKDPYLRILGENLVKYAFWVNGLKFGKNISDYIPIDIYGFYKTKKGTKVSGYKTRWGRHFDRLNFSSIDGTSHKEMKAIMAKQGIVNGDTPFRSEDNAINKYAELLHEAVNPNNNILLGTKEDLINFAVAFVKANNKIKGLVPTMKLEYGINKKLKANSPRYVPMSKGLLVNYINSLPYNSLNREKNYEDTNLLNEDTRLYIESLINKVPISKNRDIWDVIGQIIIEPIEYVNNTKISNNSFVFGQNAALQGVVRSEVKGGEKLSIFANSLYRRYDINDCAVYYPINKTLENEYDTTCVSQFSYGIEPESTYIALANILSVFVKPNYPTTTNKITHNSFTEAVDEVVNKSDIVLYIGSKNDYTYKVISDKSKVIATSVTELADILNDPIPSIIDNIDNLGILGQREGVSQLQLLKDNPAINRGLESLIQNHFVKHLNILDDNGYNITANNYARVKKGFNTTVNDVKNTPAKKSIVLDTSFVDTPTTVSGADTLQFMQKLFEIEKTAIGNTKMLNEELKRLNDKAFTAIDKSVKDSRKQIENLTTDFNLIDKYLTTIEYNQQVQQNVIKIVTTINFNYDTASIIKLFNKGRDYRRRQFLIDFNRLLSIVQSQKYIDELDYINENMYDIDDATIKKKVEEFNDKLAALKNDHKRLADIESKLNNYILEYFAALLLTKSRSNNFNTKFKHIQDELAKNGFNENVIGEYQITPQDIADTIKEMLSNNLDLSFLIRNLDSAAQSGIPLIDTVLTEYEYHVLNSEEWFRDNIMDAINLFKEFPEYFEVNSKGKPKLKYNADRARKFRSRFIDNKTNQLITPYNMDDVYEELNVAAAEYQDEYYSKLAKLDKTDPEYENQKSKIKQEYIKKYNKKRNDLITVETIKVIRNDRGEVDVEATKQKIEALRPITNTDLYYIHMLQLANQYGILNKFAEANHAKNVTNSINGIVFQIERPKINRVKGIGLKFINSRFESFNEKELDLMFKLQEMFLKLNSTAMPNVVKPINFFPSFIQDTKGKAIAKYLGWHKFQEDDYINTLSGDIQYYRKATAMNRPKIYGRYIPNVDDIDSIKDYNDFIDKVNRNAKKRNYKKEITNLKDVREYNTWIKEQHLAKYASRMNTDPFNTLINYVNQVKVIKVKRDFEPELYALQYILASDMFQARGKSTKNKNTINKVLSFLTKRTEIIQKKGKDTYAYDRFKTFLDAFEGKAVINNKVSQILNVLHISNSRSVMLMNITAAIKNIGTGHVGIVSEATGNEFTTKATLLKAHTIYVKALPALFASLGEFTTDNLDAAIMKYCGSIFEDQMDINVQSNINPLADTLAKWDNLGYLPNTIGEHYLQFATFFAAMQTHRVVAGTIMNYEQFTRSLREQLFVSMLTDEQKTKYEDYKKRTIEYEGSNVETFDFINRFISYHNNEITTEFKKEFVKRYKEQMKDAKAKFEANHPTVYEQFKLKDGRAKLKEDSNITIMELSKFMGKVKGVNHSLHGIYNTFDKAAISGSMLGEVVLQFKKWLRPNFIRYYGKRVGKVIYDERLEAYRSGAYTSFAKFILHNCIYEYKNTIMNAKENSEDVTFMTYSKALFNAIGGLIMFGKDMALRYNMLPEAEKANIRRTSFNMLAILSLTLIAAILLALKDDDDELDDSILYATLSYFIYGTQTEVYETTPLGLYSFYKRTTESVLPFERTLNNWIEIIYLSTIAQLIMDEEDLVYDRGTYKDESKLKVKVLQSIPFVNQYYKLINLPSNDTYYLMQNPLLQLSRKVVSD